MLDLAGRKSGRPRAGNRLRLGRLGTTRGRARLPRKNHHVCRTNNFTTPKARFEQAGIADQVEIALQDYRTLEGQFDAVFSCEMIEAVGMNISKAIFRSSNNHSNQARRRYYKASRFRTSAMSAIAAVATGYRNTSSRAGICPLLDAIEHNVSQRRRHGSARNGAVW